MQVRTFCVAVALLVLGVPLHADDFRQLSCQGNSAPTGFVATPGIVMAWGANNFGQLGNGANTSSNVPVQVAGLTDVAQVSAGTFHSLAVKCDGTVWAWGRNDSGQLGNGTYTDSNIPVQVSNLTGVVHVSAGDAFSLALKSDGTVWAWGYDNSGRLGDNASATCAGSTTCNSNVPVQVFGLTGIFDIAAGGAHSIASDGFQLWGWGFNPFGEVGDGTSGNFRTAPVTIQLPSNSPAINITALSAGGDDSMAQVGAGAGILAWGFNDGAWGNGSGAGSLAPLLIASSPFPVLGDQEVTAGDSHSLLAISNTPNCRATLFASGDDSHGDLGDGTNNFSDAFVQVSGLGQIDPCGAADSGQPNIAAAFHSLASLPDGTVWAWGSNSNGQLGNGTNTDSNVPVQVSGFTSVMNVAAGGDHNNGDSGHSLAIVAATVSFSSSNIGFDGIGTETVSTPQVITLTNQGPGPLTISSSLPCSNGDPGFTFTLPPFPLALASGESTNISVQYAPGISFTNALTCLLLYHNGFQLGDFRNISTIAISGSGNPDADLALSATTSPAVASPEDTLTYGMSVTNNGPALGDSVTISDVLPAGLTFVSCSATGGGFCGGTGNNRSITFAPLAPGQVTSVSIQATLNSGVPNGTVLTNSATGAIVTDGNSCSVCDPRLGNNTVAWNTTVQNNSDLFVTIQPSDSSVRSQSNLTYAVTVTNLGPYKASGVVLNDIIPANSGFVSLSGPVGCAVPAVGAVGTLTCNIGSMSSGAAATFQVTVNVDGKSNKTSLSNTASVMSASFDPNLANNSATVITPIYSNKK